MLKQILVFPPSKTMSLDEVIVKLEQEADGFLAVVDDKNKLLGVLTNGGIRRGILLQKTAICDLIDTEAFRIKAEQHPQFSSQEAFPTNQRYIPIVDHDNHLLDIFKIPQHQQAAYPNQVIIMAGGLGRRLGELTRDVPKPMLPMGHKPVLHIILDTFIEHGFREFYFCVNYKSEVIREYFGDGSSFGARIQYIQEPYPMGTAGALSLIQTKFTHPFFVMNGDLITTLNLHSLLSFHKEKEAIGTMCLHEHNQQLPFGVVHTRNSRILSLEEKPFQKYFVNAGIYLLNPEALSYIPHGKPSDMPSVFEQMLQAQEAVHAYTINEFWVDIGQMETYESTRTFFTQYKL